MTDKINPDHYKTDSGIESIDVIEAFNLNFCLGNACKYLLRAGKKEGESAITDLTKLKWYIDREIKSREKRKIPTRVLTNNQALLKKIDLECKSPHFYRDVLGELTAIEMEDKIFMPTHFAKK